MLFVNENTKSIQTLWFRQQISQKAGQGSSQGGLHSSNMDLGKTEINQESLGETLNLFRVPHKLRSSLFRQISYMPSAEDRQLREFWPSIYTTTGLLVPLTEAGPFPVLRSGHEGVLLVQKLLAVRINTLRWQYPIRFRLLIFLFGSFNYKLYTIN